MRQPAPACRALPEASAITGLVLAGGRAQRMGGLDKGLRPWRGKALVDHAVARLAPQVSSIMISANRNAEEYGVRGYRVLADAVPDFPGPLAGVLAGLRAAATPWVAVVPCDAPLLPSDLVARLCAAVAEGPPDYEGAVAQHEVEGLGSRIEPVICLLPVDVADDLARYLEAGGRKVEPWLLCHVRPVSFDRAEDRGAFANFNTLEDLRR